MRKIYSLFLFLFSFIGFNAQDAGIFESYAILKINNGSNAYYDLQAVTGNPDLTQITQLKFFEISLWGNPKFRRTIFCVFW